MNKAFVRESDAPPPRCPAPEGCGGPGTAVTPETLAALLPEARRERFSSQVYWCAAPDCPVAYFDAWGATAPAVELASVSWPKNPEGAVCSCLGVKAEEIIRDAKAGRRDRVREILAHARSGDARCAERAPDGLSCERAVRKLFLEHMPPAPGD